MKVRALITTVLLVHSSLALSSEAWGPELIAFELEGGSKNQTMLWLSGFSYSSTELLRSARCLKSGEHIGSKELIVTLNEVFGGKRVSSEAATRVLGKYIRSRYVCAAYNQPVQPTADAAAD